MTTKRPIYLFLIAVFAAFLYLGTGYLFQVRATLPCPPSGCPKGACGYQGCGDKCHCRGGACGDWSRVCTYCDPNPCSQIYGGDWSEGRCSGGSGCEERRFECNCGNKAYYCHRTKTGPSSTPTPSRVPSPTPTKPPPTPTPLQPTLIVTIAQPSPGAFSDKAVDSTTKKAAQNWVCLKTVPCATGGITCSGGDPKHRVQISAKEGSKLIASKKTYIFECVQTDKGYRCTTGNTTLDQELLGAQHLGPLATTYGYKFIAFTTAAGKSINQSDSSQVMATDKDGKIGPLEWESYTTTQVGRIMMGMQSVNSGDNLTGNEGAQQQGTFDFGDQGNKTTCVMIKWDPHGVVFDSLTLKPLPGVTVTLLQPDQDGRFTPMKEGEVFGGVVNPQVTDTDGAFAFYVPNGTYKLLVSKPGYVPYFYKNVGMNGKYDNIYDGGEIVTNGKLELRNIPMRPETIFDKILSFFTRLFK